jgi:hypothetical protein
MGIALQPLEIDALALTPLLEEAEAFLELVAGLFGRTSLRVPVVVLAKIAEQPASFSERAVFTPAIAVVEDALDEVCFVHAPPCCKKRSRTSELFS